MRKYTNEERLKYIDMILNDGISLHEIEREYDIPRRTLRDWTRKYEEHGRKYFQEKSKRSVLKLKKNATPMEKLEYENFMLKLEIERLRRGYSTKDVKRIKKKK